MNTNTLTLSARQLPPTRPSPVRPFACSPAHLLTISPVRPLIHSCSPSPLSLPAYSLVHLSIRPFCLIRSVDLSTLLICSPRRPALPFPLSASPTCSLSTRTPYRPTLPVVLLSPPTSTPCRAALPVDPCSPSIRSPHRPAPPVDSLFPLTRAPRQPALSVGLFPSHLFPGCTRPTRAQPSHSHQSASIHRILQHRCAVLATPSFHTQITPGNSGCPARNPALAYNMTTHFPFPRRLHGLLPLCCGTF